MRLRLPVASFVGAAFTFVTATAFAQDPAAPAPANAPATGAARTAQPASPTAEAEKDKPKKDADEEELKRITLTANPLSLLLTRIGVNFEYMLAKHHALVANPYFQSNSVEVGSGNNTTKTSYTTFGGEVGYRFYTGSRGANGFFVGPSVFVQNTASSVTTTSPNANSNADGSTLVYGGIVDLGGQHVTKGGFTIGAGAGIMYLVAANEPNASSSTVKFSGVLPRFLLTVGYSF